MSSVPEGRAANQADSVDTFSPPIAPPEGASVIAETIGSPASSVAVTCAGLSALSFALASRSAGASVRE